jgi:hypothetical protein
VYPFGTCVDPGHGCFNRVAIIGFRSGFTLGESYRLAVGNVYGWKKFKVFAHVFLKSV